MDPITPPDSELDAFYKALADTGTKPVVLSTIEPYSDSYVPRLVTNAYPKVLSTFYDDKLITASHSELAASSEIVIVTVTEEQAKEVEKATQLQYKLWNRVHAGRIMAS